MPLPCSTPDELYLPALASALAEHVVPFSPSYIILDLGLDALATDLLARQSKNGLGLSLSAYTEIGRMVRQLGKGVVVVAQGGYDIDNIGEAFARCIFALQTEG